MRAFTIAVFLIFWACSAYADTYCQWTGSAPQNCVNTKLLPSGDQRATMPSGKNIIVTPEIAAEHAYYPRVTVLPAYNEATQKLGAVQYSFDGTTITRTWAVEALTVNEQNEYLCDGFGVMLEGLVDHLVNVGMVTNDGNTRVYIKASEVDAALRSAYQACKALP